MEFDHDEYKACLIKLLDIARESHWYLLDRVVVRQFDIAKTYLWTSSVIGAVAMFMIKEVASSPISNISLGISVSFASISFLLGMLILWGSLFGTPDASLLEPTKLGDFAHEQFLNSETPYSSVYGGIINSINSANEKNIATNAKRAAILRIAAPFLILSFLSMMLSIMMRILHV